MVRDAFGQKLLNPYHAKGWIGREAKSIRQSLVNEERTRLLAKLVEEVAAFLNKSGKWSAPMAN